MANGDFAGLFERREGGWTGTMQLNGEEIPVLVLSYFYFEDESSDYVVYQSATPKPAAIGEAWSNWSPAPKRTWRLELKVNQPESYFHLRHEPDDRWVLSETLPFIKPEPEPIIETWPTHYERPNRSLCERCGETYHVDNLDDCKKCRVTFCYNCGTGDYCNRCAEGRKKQKTPPAPEE